MYNINIDYELSFIKSSDLTRLMFISTYLDYNCSLSHDNHKTINKSNMNNLLKLSDREFKYFYQEMIKNNIFTEQENKVYINTSFFYKGDISNNLFNDKNITRLYINGVREIYNKSLPKSHKQLSYIFKVLPFVNIHYNIICKNPLEYNMDKIIPMTISEFCQIIHYDKKNIKRLINIFSNCYNIKNEYILSFVLNQDLENAKMFINPYIYYAGNEWDKVKFLGCFCKRK